MNDRNMTDYPPAPTRSQDQSHTAEHRVGRNRPSGYYGHGGWKNRIDQDGNWPDDLPVGGRARQDPSGSNAPARRVASQYTSTATRRRCCASKVRPATVIVIVPMPGGARHIGRAPGSAVNCFSSRRVAIAEAISAGAAPASWRLTVIVGKLDSSARGPVAAAHGANPKTSTLHQQRGPDRAVG